MRFTMYTPTDLKFPDRGTLRLQYFTAPALNLELPIVIRIYVIANIRRL